MQAFELRAESLLPQDRARETIADLEWATRTFALSESLSSLLALARQEPGSHAEALRDLERPTRTHRPLDRRTAADDATPMRSA